MKDRRQEAEAILRDAECLHDAAAVSAALERMAQEVEARLAATRPVVLAVLLGGLYTAAWLTQRLTFDFELDYVHATRYRDAEPQSEPLWVALPRTPLAGRHVLIVDDVLDGGITLAHIHDYCIRAGAREALSAVLVRKNLQRGPHAATGDFVGLEAPDRFLVGCGMDYRGMLRGRPEVLALAADHKARDS